MIIIQGRFAVDDLIKWKNPMRIGFFFMRIGLDSNDYSDLLRLSHYIQTECFPDIPELIH